VDWIDLGEMSLDIQARVALGLWAGAVDQNGYISMLLQEITGVETWSRQAMNLSTYKLSDIASIASA
jgi:hypothetical protein